MLRDWPGKPHEKKEQKTTTATKSTTSTRTSTISTASIVVSVGNRLMIASHNDSSSAAPSRAAAREGAAELESLCEAIISRLPTDTTIEAVEIVEVRVDVVDFVAVVVFCSFFSCGFPGQSRSMCFVRSSVVFFDRSWHFPFSFFASFFFLPFLGGPHISKKQTCQR